MNKKWRFETYLFTTGKTFTLHNTLLLTMLCAESPSNCYLFQFGMHPCKLKTFIISISWIGNWASETPGHTGRKRQSWNSNPGLQISRLCLIYHMTLHHTGSGKYGERAVDWAQLLHKSYYIWPGGWGLLSQDKNNLGSKFFRSFSNEKWMLSESFSFRLMGYSIAMKQNCKNKTKHK